MKGREKKRREEREEREREEREREERKREREKERKREREKERKREREKDRRQRPPPCVESKRLRVYRQDVSACTGNGPACVQQAGVLPVHTEAC